jgi:hypothetical protein
MIFGLAGAVLTADGLAVGQQRVFAELHSAVGVGVAVGVGAGAGVGPLELPPPPPHAATMLVIAAAPSSRPFRALASDVPPFKPP